MPAKCSGRELKGDVPTLEEVWFDEGENVWVVTVGIRHREYSPLPLGREMQRLVDYKTVRISAKHGKPLSIKLHPSAA